MKIRKYHYQRLHEYMYRFFSTGPRGEFEIRVSFNLIHEKIFNLGFGVLDNTSQQLDDKILLRNNDTDMILATVSEIAFDFLATKPGLWIMAAGSTAARTRKYQMGISKYQNEISQRYRILGLICERDEQGEAKGEFPNWVGSWQDLRAGINYDAFLISRLQ